MSASSVAWPLLGHLPAFHADTNGFLLRLARQQGDVARFRLGRREAILLSNPEHITAVLIEQAAAFTKGRLMQRARCLLGNGLLTSEGGVHRDQRRRIQPLFARDRLYQYAAEVPGIVARQTARWLPGAPMRMDIEMDRLAMSVVARTLLGVDLEQEAPELGRTLRRISRWAPLLAPYGRAAEPALSPLVRRLRETVETAQGVVPGDQAMTIFLAGHDTTAAALAWTWLLLGTHPEVEARLHQELTAAPGKRQLPATDDSSLPYTEMVITETLRLYPPVGRIGRRPTRDIEIDGVMLPRDSAVFLSPYVTQRDPRWFPRPDEFRPERWADPAPHRPRFAWFPFGVGPRSCVGEHFARVVLLRAVAAIARSWRLRAVAPLPKPRSLLTLKPRGAVWMVAEPRAPRPSGVDLPAHSVPDVHR